MRVHLRVAARHGPVDEVGKKEISEKLKETNRRSENRSGKVA
ncbi:hypothetical protein ACFQ7N_10215 [Streptomyces niveus]